MVRQAKMITKKRGRPATGVGTLIGVRFQPDSLAQVDEWREKEADQPSRPEAIRRLVDKGIGLGSLNNAAGTRYVRDITAPTMRTIGENKPRGRG